MNTGKRVATWNFGAGTQPLPLIIAHRGDQSTAPENTLAAFRRALSAGADGVELDVRLTLDGQLVVFHDRRLDRTSNGSGLVSEHTLAEVKSLDVGAWFGPKFRREIAPTLDEVFETLPRGFLVNVEMKVVINGIKLIARRVAETIIRHQRLSSTLVASFNPMALCYLRKIEPRITRGYIWSKHHPLPIRARWFSPLVQAHWYDPADDTYCPRLHRRLQRRGKRVLAWDVDFGGDFSMMASARLDAVVTEHLDTMVARKRALAQS
ncbi:MAG: glycerophosphodiester phosphodiesterase family protein [Chloroflexota bacterium]